MRETHCNIQRRTLLVFVCREYVSQKLDKQSVQYFDIGSV